MTKFKYQINYGGGRGDEVWDSTIEVEADNIMQALKLADDKLEGAATDNNSECAIFAIEQID